MRESELFDKISYASAEICQNYASNNNGQQLSVQEELHILIKLLCIEVEDKITKTCDNCSSLGNPDTCYHCLKNPTEDKATEGSLGDCWEEKK